MVDRSAETFLRSMELMASDLHSSSHGESFLSLIESRFGRQGFYVMDEPESALSFGAHCACCA